LPIELIAAMPAAALRPDRNSVGGVQSCSGETVRADVASKSLMVPARSVRARARRLG